MFQVGRYDPREEERKQKRQAKQNRSSEESSSKKKKKPKASKKTKRKHQVEEQAKEASPITHESQETKASTTTLRVIAPETQGAISSEKRLNTKLTEEAFDDLDLGNTSESDTQHRETTTR